MLPFEPEALPPGDLDLLALMPAVGRANRAVATLEGLFYGIPNPDILLSPITTQEAVLSSKIEGTQADFEDVLKFEAGEPPVDQSRRDDIREIMNYRQALRQGERLLRDRPFCLNSLLALHETLMDSVRGFDKGRGRFRTVQNWIGTAGSPIEQAVYVPPSPLGLQSHLDRWEAYWHSEAPDVLIQLALLHAQFEIIHPFVDGNGRLGRMVIPLFLFEKKILSQPCFYLSAYFEARREAYITHLRELGQTPGGWTRWCAFFLDGVATQAEANTVKARAIQDLYERLKRQVLDLTHSQFAVPLLDFIFSRPIFRSSDLTKLDEMPSAPMVATLLGKLRQAGILQTIREGAGRRPHILALAELINLCEGRKVL
ncbi:MAG: Adenosine monophosphate-protein transferase SoFic [Verrucomicrobia bacterium ADurb.Bin122]|nr:MAG: Adenosine monophosphate-protein transferase SoFic [Verrucomicrobia bacterium ADurb.Bin122]